MSKRLVRHAKWYGYRAVVLFWRLLLTFIHRAREGDISRVAGAMAFELFLGIVPLVAFLGYLTGKLAKKGIFLVSTFQVTDLAPRPAALAAREELDRLSQSEGSLAPLALLGFFWLASGAAHVALEAVRDISHAKPRSYVKNRAIGMAYTLIALCLAAASLVCIVVINKLAQLGSISTGAATVIQLSVYVLSAFAIALEVAILYRLALGSSHKGYPIWPGTIFSVMAFLIVSYAFSLYVSDIARYTVFYGSLAAVAMMLMWLWLSSITLLLGAELNQMIAERNERLFSNPPERKTRPSVVSSVHIIPDVLLEPPPSTQRSPEQPSEHR